MSDRWFSSVPTQTNPNRAFSLCGTSLGRSSTDRWGSISLTRTRCGMRCRRAELGHLLPRSLEERKVSHRAHVSAARRGEGRGGVRGDSELSAFFAHAAAGTLPAFSYLEPVWGYGQGTPDGFLGRQGTDYHPPTWLGPGEALLNQVYEALSERGTLGEDAARDHVRRARRHLRSCRPGLGRGAARCAYRARTASRSTATASGCRPSSPRRTLPRARCFRAPADSPHPFDHCSLIATILEVAGRRSRAAGLGNRVAVAPTFESALDGHERSDIPTVQVPPAMPARTMASLASSPPPASRWWTSSPAWTRAGGRRDPEVVSETCRAGRRSGLPEAHLLEQGSEALVGAERIEPRIDLQRDQIERIGRRGPWRAIEIRCRRPPSAK